MNWIRKTYKRLFKLPSRSAIVIFSLLFCTLLFYVLYKNQLDIILGLFCSLLLASVLIPLPKIGRTIFATLSLITYPIGFLVSFITLAIIYFVILTPVGLLRNRTFTSGWNQSTVTMNKSKLYE